MSDQVINLTPDQRRQVFDVLERLHEFSQRLPNNAVVTVRPPAGIFEDDAFIEIWAGVAEVYYCSVLAIFHRLQEPPPPIPRPREWYWDLARPADAKELEQAITIIRSLEAGR